MAAEQGYADAQNNFGVMYENSEGVPQDYAEALRWYRRAAEQGDAIAQVRPRPHVRQRPGCAPGRRGGREVAPQGRQAGGRRRGPAPSERVTIMFEEMTMGSPTRSVMALLRRSPNDGLEARPVSMRSPY